MKTLHLVVTENCELCEKGLNTISLLNKLFKINTVQVEDGFQEYLLRVPVLLNGNKVLDEGILNKGTILKNYLFS
jgi:capsule polysaccharide export protein KpsC/LpsZ